MAIKLPIKTLKAASGPPVASDDPKWSPTEIALAAAASKNKIGVVAPPAKVSHVQKTQVVFDPNTVGIPTKEFVAKINSLMKEHPHKLGQGPYTKLPPLKTYDSPTIDFKVEQDIPHQQFVCSLSISNFSSHHTVEQAYAVDLLIDGQKEQLFHEIADIMLVTLKGKILDKLYQHFEKVDHGQD